MRVPNVSKRILVLCPYPPNTGAGQRLKFEQYYADWREAGCEVQVSAFMDMSMWRVLFCPGHVLVKLVGMLKGYARRFRDLTRVSRFDLVYVHMWVAPIGPSILEKIVRRLSRIIIVDVEDSVLNTSHAIAENHPNPLRRYFNASANTRYLVKVADHVIASSPELAAQCRVSNLNGRATYISSSVDTDRFIPANPYSNDHPVTVGWTGTFSSRPYLDDLIPVFQSLARKRRFKLRVIGNFDYDLPGVDLEVVAWSAEREVQDLQAIDIGVYPLRADDWVGGKSGLKAIQYMAFALPCVASDAGFTPQIIRDGENGILVSSAAEWEEALTRLIDNPSLRRTLGAQARRDVLDRYSTRVTAAKYRKVFSESLKVGA